VLNRRLSRKAMAPGAISMAMARMIPTACSAATIASEMRASRP